MTDNHESPRDPEDSAAEADETVEIAPESGTAGTDDARENGDAPVGEENAEAADDDAAGDTTGDPLLFTELAEESGKPKKTGGLFDRSNTPAWAIAVAVTVILVVSLLGLTVVMNTVQDTKGASEAQIVSVSTAMMEAFAEDGRYPEKIEVANGKAKIGSRVVDVSQLESLYVAVDATGEQACVAASQQTIPDAVHFLAGYVDATQQHSDVSSCPVEYPFVLAEFGRSPVG